MGDERENGLNKQQHEEDDTYSSTTTTNNNVEREDGEEEEKKREFEVEVEEESLYAAVSGLLIPIFFPDHHNNNTSSSSSIFKRTRVSVRDNFPRIRDASRNSGLKLLRWARQGSPLRLLLLISVGTITLLTLTGILVFLLFLAAATTNAVILSLFMSLAAAGGFLAIFFACVAAIYIGALSVAVFVISSATVSGIIAVAIVTGWIGFFWILWATIRKSVGIAKHSATVTGSALSAYTSAWHSHRQHHD